MSYAVYTGAWTNWSQGRIAGTTLTLPSQHGAYLVAFLALFVRFAGSHFWGLCCYACFQMRSSQVPRDGIYHQQQAILRNSASALRSLVDWAKMTLAWRKQGQRPALRSAGFMIWAVIHVSIFAVAGIFSSKVTRTGSEVLMRGDICGMWESPSVQAVAGYAQNLSYFQV